MTPTIFNLKTFSSLTHPFTKVDRSSPWGNPYIMRNQSEAERNYVCDRFAAYALWRLMQEPQWLEPLRGKHLACWCAPKRCHAETLLRLANEEKG
jgi:hypothetical protein